MQMFYAERISDDGTREKGIFFWMEEFLPYRAEGWSSTEENNRVADAMLAAAREE
jgi:hypothetical protein